MRARSGTRGIPFVWLLSLALSGPGEARAQATADVMLLPQYGGRLYQEPGDQRRAYGRFDLTWSRAAFSLGGRFEFEQVGAGSDAVSDLAQYAQITQRWAQWRDPRLTVRVGQFHTILGSGLLHRSYELPGVVYEEPGTRSRYAASRDLDGALVEGRAGPLEARGFAGRFNDATFSPASEDRGADRYGSDLAGGQTTLRFPWNARLGAGGLRETTAGGDRRSYASVFAGADLLSAWNDAGWSLPVTVERSGSGELPGADPSRASGLYGSATLLWWRWSLSGEWKDYSRLRLGFNDPPPLVREQSWALLNRNTHVQDAEDEQGHQFELTAPVHSWLTLVANWSRADGAPNGFSFKYEEQFAELRFGPGSSEAWELRAYADRGYDTHDFISDRRAEGALLAARLPGEWAGEFDVERQHVVRGGVFVTPPFDDLLVTLGVSRSGWGSAAVSVTRTTDPLDLPSDLFGEPTEPSATFVGVNLTAELGLRHRAELFAGRRRGGRACVSGTCYDVPSLEGVELRWTSRLP